jgi:hypothetical protein
MINHCTLAASGEQLTQLDDDALATIVGGEIPWGKIVGEAISLLWECVKTGIDDVIDAAAEGYGDAQAS